MVILFLIHLDFKIFLTDLAGNPGVFLNQNTLKPYMPSTAVNATAL